MLPGFEALPATAPGAAFVGSPWRVVLHTTEGGSIEGAVGAYRATTDWPHFTVDVGARRRVQHYDLNVSARALMHPAGTGETNRANAVQIEMVGFAAATPAWSTDDLTWLANAVLAPIRAVCPFAANAPEFVAYPASAGTNARQRMTEAQWAAFTGVCGHEHVPHNDHGDPGAIDVGAILRALGSPVPQPKPQPIGEEDVFLVKGDASPDIWVTNAVHKRKVLEPNEVGELIYATAAGGAEIHHGPGNGVLVWPQHLVDRIPTAA